MARTKAVLGEGRRLADHLVVAYLVLNCPLGRVREVLDELGLQGKRRRDLPAEVVFFYTLSLCLYRTVAYEEVLRIVVEGLRAVLGDGIADVVPTKGAISRARARLGSLPLERMYAERVQAIGREDSPGVMYKGLRVMRLMAAHWMLLMRKPMRNIMAILGHHEGHQPGRSCALLRWPRAQHM